VLVLDDTNRSRVEEDEALRRLTVAMATMYTEDDTELHLEELRTDDVTVGHPEVYVMPPRGDRPLLVGTDRSLDVPVRSLRALADRVTPGDEDVRLEGRDTRGRPVVLVGRPYEEDDELLAVGIVVVDPQAGAAGHRRLRWAVGAGVLVLECGVALAGHALAGRMLRPVVANLDAHEAFLADAAHELRAPVAAIRAAAGRGDTERVVRQAARLGDTVEALLTRSRLAAGVQVVRRTPVRLDLLVEEVVADRTGEAAGGVDDVVVEAGPTVVEADPALVAIAVRNLIDNGLRHGHRPEEPARVTVRVDGPRVTVIDRGPGVPPSLEGDRFDRYVTSGGAGLGLSIAAAVAAGHGGCLRVDAADGGGAAFVLTLAS
ncbi:MAG: two-component system, OmpR family, sensor kinase, partial [Actinomycetota bacterium]|nr:two-component system, OmpR family, sensor kinase [Actinomycetota bacterium]